MAQEIYTSYEDAFEKIVQCVQLPGNRDARHRKTCACWRGRTHRSTLHWHDREQRKVLSVYKALENNGYRPEEFERVYAPMGLEIGALSPKRLPSVLWRSYCRAAECGVWNTQETQIRVGPRRFTPWASAEGSTCWPPSSCPAGLEPNELAESVASLPGAAFPRTLLEVTSHRASASAELCSARTPHPSQSCDLKADEIVINHEWEKGQLIRSRRRCGACRQGQTACCSA